MSPRRPFALCLCLALACCTLKSGGELRRGWDGSTLEDTDGDGIPDDQPDNCPTTPNRSQADFDGDGIGNVCDPDAWTLDVDADGIDDRIDMCLGEQPGTNEDGDVHPSAPWQIVDDCDNCPCVPNPDQANADGDDIGDACEPPDPTTLANILFFDRLREDVMGWRFLDLASWDFVSGSLVATPSLVVHAVAPDAVAGRTGTRFAIETTLSMQEPTGPVHAGVLLASLLNPSRTALDSWTACVLETGTTATLVVSIRAMEAGCTSGACELGEALRFEDTGVVFDPAAAYRLYAQREGNRISCSMGSTTVSMTAAALPPGGPGLTAAAAATFGSVTVYSP